MSYPAILVDPTTGPPPKRTLHPFEAARAGAVAIGAAQVTPVVHVDAPGAGIRRELRVVDADPAEQTFQRIGAAGDHRDVWNVPFGAVARKARQFRVRDRVGGAVGHARIVTCRRHLPT